MELLIENLTPTESHIITESSQDGKNVWLNGIFMMGNIKNRNGRNYPLTEIQRAVTTGQSFIKERNGIFGELDHPQTLNLNLDRISHVITELALNGSNAIGKLRLLDTPMGLIGKTLVNSGVRIGVSSRGAGNVTESGDVSDFNFITIDIVATPSAPEAMPSAVYENVMNSVLGNKALTLAEQVVHDKDAQKFFAKQMKKFISEMLEKGRMSVK